MIYVLGAALAMAGLYLGAALLAIVVFFAVIAPRQW